MMNFMKATLVVTAGLLLATTVTMVVWYKFMDKINALYSKKIMTAINHLDEEA